MSSKEFFLCKEKCWDRRPGRADVSFSWETLGPCPCWLDLVEQNRQVLPAFLFWASFLGKVEMGLYRNSLVWWLGWWLGWFFVFEIRSNSNISFTSCPCNHWRVKYTRVSLRLFCENIFLVFLVVKKQMECQQGAGKDWGRNWASHCLTVLCEPFHTEV